MKWIGQHIWDFISRFRSDVYLEDLTESAQDHVVGIDADGKLYKQDVAVGDITNVRLNSDTGTHTESSGTANFVLTGGNAIGTTNSGNDFTINHSDTSSQASINNSTHTFIQDISLDTYGHITSIGSASIPDETIAGGVTGLHTRRVSITQPNFNSLHTTPIELIPNPGGDKIIIPVRAICIIDQAKVQSNSFCDLNIHYDIGGGVGGYGVNTLLHIRRFMWNQSSDIIYYVPGPNGLKVGTTTASAVNKAVQVSVDSEIYGPSGPGDDNVLNASNIWISYYIINMA